MIGREVDESEPSVLRWLISADESGVGGATHYGFGSLWMRWERRGDFAALVRTLRERHRYNSECKWNKVKRFTLPFYLDLVEEFFKRPWLVFHCIVCRRSDIDKALHGGDWDLARRKHFTMLLTDKVKRCLERHRGREQTFRVWVDPIHSRYRKADEAVEVIANNVIAKAVGGVRTVDKVITRDSKETASIQLCDLLLGAVMDAWQERAAALPKREIQASIARHLGWPDLRAATYRTERKFNVWYFWDPLRGGERRVKARPIRLVYPLPQ